MGLTKVENEGKGKDHKAENGSVQPAINNRSLRKRSREYRVGLSEQRCVMGLNKSLEGH